MLWYGGNLPEGYDFRYDTTAAPQALSNPSLDGPCDDVCRGRIDLGEYDESA